MRLVLKDRLPRTEEQLARRLQEGKAGRNEYGWLC